METKHVGRNGKEFYLRKGASMSTDAVSTGGPLARKPAWSMPRHPSLRAFSLLACFLLALAAVEAAEAPQDPLTKAGHVLNRVAYGPSPADLARVQAMGVEAYLEEQLGPADLAAGVPPLLQELEDALFVEKVAAREDVLIAAGTLWRYVKGVRAPGEGWQKRRYRDAHWSLGATGIGYGDDDDATVLDDMQNQYLSVYLRQTIQLSAEALAEINQLLLRVDYDDGFRAYLNGRQVANANLPSGTITHQTAANGSHEAGTPEEFDLSPFLGLLREGANVLAIEVHNRSLTSSDLSMIPELVNRILLPGPPLRVIRDVDALQQLVHVRGVHTDRQLQTVLAEFWENHFTTDYDKLVDYFDELTDSDATDAMPRGQAESEAAHAEYQEYQFFYDNALGYFGDLLLYSATSPTMLIYLDNVLNVKGAANENYSREILELFAFGVDNRYTQKDIEELAMCFTGWTVCKVLPDQALPFPAAALTPPTRCGVQFVDDAWLDLGPRWRYFKGRREPSPAGDSPTTEWTQLGFDASGWSRGSTGIGYGDGDDATVLMDMRNQYLSVYLRRSFVVEDPDQFENLLLLEVRYDDGYVAYLNGTEVARSETMKGQGTPPAFDQRTDGGHEASEGADYINLNRFLSLLRPGENVLALQAHNVNLGSSDLTIAPRLIERRILPGSIEHGDRNGTWVFRFDPELHDTGAKVLFGGTEHEIRLPARSGEGAAADGLEDTLVVVQGVANHPSTKEYICIKLVQRFVSDEVTLTSFKDRSAPAELLDLVDAAIVAWGSTAPPGHIETVMRTLLDPSDQAGVFWSPRAYRSKVKTAIEFINSSLRALESDATGAGLPELNRGMGMDLFKRDDPDGFSELGFDWMDTASMLNRIEFAKSLAENKASQFGWDIWATMDNNGLVTAEDVVDYFDTLLFQGELSAPNRELLLEFLNTNDSGAPEPLDRYNRRKLAAFEEKVQSCVGLILSLPQWQFQ